MDSKGQGALEYLLLIGGAILIAAFVLVMLSGLGTTTSNQANGSLNTFFNKVNA